MTENNVEPMKTGFYVTGAHAVMSIPAKLRELLGWENKATVWAEPIENGKGFVAFSTLEDLMSWRSKGKAFGEHTTPASPTTEQHDTTSGGVNI